MKSLEKKLWDKHYSKCVVICFWLFGLCNNFAYVVMLSAAHDILSTGDDHSNLTNTSSSNPTTLSNSTNRYDCNEMSTGTILLADILPGIIIKILAPFFVHHIKYTYRIVMVVIVNIMCYLIVALAPSGYTALVFFGVCCASASSSFGELTFLSMSSLYKRDLSLTGWGSGTGAAGLIGSFGYAAMTQAGLTPKATILIMIVIPIILVFSYIALPSLEYVKSRRYKDVEGSSDTSDTEATVPPNTTSTNTLVHNNDSTLQDSTYKTKLNKGVDLLRPLIKYMIPLFLVYWAEYFINQGLFELLYFKNSTFAHKDQYRWYNVIYQLAVFISRTSIKFIQTKRLYIFPILQILNVALALSQIYFGYLGSIWFVFLLIFWEGLLGGGCYVNAFNLVSIEIPKANREFSMGVVSIADGVGIAFAGFTSLPVHNSICAYGRR